MTVATPDEPAGFLTRQRRIALLATMGAVAALELALAWRTEGTYDITIWRSFAQTVDRIGPIDIYRPDSVGLMVYNHPPLVGWWLIVVNAATAIGLPFGFMVRLPSIVAHVASVALVYDMVRRRRPGLAVACAFGVALSPLLVIIAGYHGNNDPVVAAFLLASVWLLVDRRRPAWAGFAFSLAVSVKIIPLVVLPVLLLVAWRLGRKDLSRFVIGGVPVFALLWAPVLVLSTKGFLSHVMLYNGSGFPRQWGPYQFAHGIGVPQAPLDLYVRPGTYLIVLVCALLPAWFIRHTPDRAPLAVAVALCMFVLISPGWAAQYVAWIAAAVFLIELWPALVFTVGAGIVYTILYFQWEGDVRPLTSGQIWILLFAWLALVPAVVVGLRRLARQRPAERTEDVTIAP